MNPTPQVPGWNDVLATLSAGRYLAKDAGVTVQLSRVFKNGVTVGAFFSKTNVSAAQFGEGSFDKGAWAAANTGSPIPWPEV